MTVSEIMQPLTIFFNWFRSFQMNFGEFSFSFMDIFIWGMLAGIVVGAIARISGD